MYFTPTIFLVKLVAAMQVLMVLDVPVSTTMALPVTSKPIESTVENLAWQAWIELPPEEKQQVKSRKVTPKSIFTLPFRVECPDGHKQVDSKCIPIAMGNNNALIDLSALGLLVGSTQPEDIYDYDDMSEELANPLSFGSEVPVEDGGNSAEGLAVELKPPSQDEPLKFNIFQNKFHILHEEPLEDYSSISNEGGVQSSEKELNITAATNQSSILTTNVTAINNLVSDATNFSENNSKLTGYPGKNNSAADSEAEESNTFTTLPDTVHFKIDAISVPAFTFDTLKQNILSVVEDDHQHFKQLAGTTTSSDDRDKQQESDIQTLLQTESFLPLLNQTTATTLQQTTTSGENLSLTTVAFQETSEHSADFLNLNVDEEITTVPNIMEQDFEFKSKQEYTRSVTLHPTINKDYDIGRDNDDSDLGKDSTLEAVTNIEPFETTTPIQLDETTIIETDSSLSATPSTQQELKELLLQHEQAVKDFKEFQRIRKGQKDQNVVLKKSKVQPVEVLSTTTEALYPTTTLAKITTDDLPTDELLASASSSSSSTTTEETMTPLLTVRNNENDNNDRFYYQHFANQDNQVIQRSCSELEQKTEITAAASAPIPVAVAGLQATEIETLPLTSEIDLDEEMPLINELVKGMLPANNVTITTTTRTAMTTTTTTTEKPITSTAKVMVMENIQLSSSLNSLSESSSVPKKQNLSAAEIWRKIMPLLTTSTTTASVPKGSQNETFKQQNESVNDFNTATTTIPSASRSNRNSKIFRINNMSEMTSSTATTTSNAATATELAATNLLEESSPSLATTTTTTSTTNSQEPYWWLPVAWRLNKPATNIKQQKVQQVNANNQSLLLRFWAAYRPRSS